MLTSQEYTQRHRLPAILKHIVGQGHRQGHLPGKKPKRFQVVNHCTNLDFLPVTSVVPLPSICEAGRTYRSWRQNVRAEMHLCHPERCTDDSIGQDSKSDIQEASARTTNTRPHRKLSRTNAARLRATPTPTDV